MIHYFVRFKRTFQQQLVATEYAKGKIMKNGNGIRLYFTIPCDHLVSFFRGDIVQAWPTAPHDHCPGATSPKDRAKYFPKGGTQIRIDPDKVEVGECPDGVFTIQRKDVEKRPARKPYRYPHLSKGQRLETVIVPKDRSPNF